jgi:hypothetical protein
LESCQPGSDNGNLAGAAAAGAEPEAQGYSARATWGRLALAATAYLAVGFIGAHATQARGLPSGGVAAIAIVAGVAFIGIEVAIIALVARLPLSAKSQLALVIAFGLVFGAALVVQLRLRASEGSPIALVRSVALMIAATAFGVMASRIVRERNLLVPVAVVAGAVDIWGVYFGFVAEVQKKAPEIAQHLSAAVPAASAAQVPVPLLSAVGPGDFLFMGLFVAAVRRLRMNLRATLWALFVAFLIVPAVFAVAGLPALPGLPFIGVAVIVANWRHFRFSRAEKFAVLYAVLGIAAAVGVGLGVRELLR